MTTADDNDSTKLESSRKRKYDGNQSGEDGKVEKLEGSGKFAMEDKKVNHIGLYICALNLGS
ncbi:hypothetical protein LINPERHAP2_LOCUS5221 [Linum perenne]